jgi:hypothetical protein
MEIVDLDGRRTMASAAIGGTYVLTSDGARQLAEMVDNDTVASLTPNFESRYVGSDMGRLSALQDLVRAHSAS